MCRRFYAHSCHCLDSFEASYLEYYRILPLETTPTHVRVAVSGDPNPDVLADWSAIRACRRAVPVSNEELTDGIRRAYAAAESIVEVVKDLRSNDGFQVPKTESSPTCVTLRASLPSSST